MHRSLRGSMLSIGAGQHEQVLSGTPLEGEQGGKAHPWKESRHCLPLPVRTGGASHLCLMDEIPKAGPFPYVPKWQHLSMLSIGTPHTCLKMFQHPHVGRGSFKTRTQLLQIYLLPAVLFQCQEQNYM